MTMQRRRLLGCALAAPAPRLALADDRWPARPARNVEVPTIAQCAVQGYQAASWFGLLKVSGAKVD
jgi:hypothetical protein